MTQFYVVEVQQYKDGTYGHIVHFAFDEDSELARLKAESKYYEVLAAAAVSDLPTHGAIMFDSMCLPRMNYSYTHRQNIEPIDT